MKLCDFSIGKTFFFGMNVYLCTDIGSRTVSAVLIEPDMEPELLSGPPFTLNEVVVDEIDQTRCFTDEIVMLQERLRSNHPGFSSTAVRVMLAESTGDEHHAYPYKKVFGRCRKGHSGEFLHPYTARRHNAGWIVRCYDIYQQIFTEVDHKELIRMSVVSQDQLPEKR